ncbi:transglutaminase-like domain-containing protein [Ruania albidiflava]|uniref:transglutaminase-like domain-containing protein n=1 Tax=Ruania albidiflava TaxID=366586 RepID=UPI0003B69D1E|nr:transglutaminase-like domain-containing protein [Ruania albidiflava]
MTLLRDLPSAVDRWTRHSAYSDPGPYGDLLRAVDPTTEAVSATARNLIAHYRGEAHLVPASTRADIHLRWLADQLATDQDRHHTPLTEPRALSDRLQGCCRDHSLFCVGALREHGVPARTRIGFAGYLSPGFHHDHVVVERLDGTRWVRFDPELAAGFTDEFDVTDMPTGPSSPFQTAAEVWREHRTGHLDVTRYGVDLTMDEPLRGAPIVAAYVIGEVAHRHGDELLLWDVWGQCAEDPTADPDLIDDVAALLLAADAEEQAGELDGPRARALADRYAADERLHPGAAVWQLSPLQPGRAPVQVPLR